MSYANYCIERDLEDRKSSCFLERITSDERGTDFSKTKNDVWRHIVPSSPRPVLTERSCGTRVREVRGCVHWCSSPCQSWSLGAGVCETKMKDDTILALNWCVLLAKRASWALTCPSTCHLPHSRHCLLPQTSKHLWKEHSTITKLEKPFVSHV